MSFLAISDKDPARAKALAEQAGADFHTGSNEEIIAHPDVTAVIVSTPEQEHTAPILQALKLGKPVLVEKPIGFSLSEADTHPRDPARDQGQSAGRLQPPLQGMLPARQGADAARPARHGRRRHRARLQFARAGVRDPQARSARHAGARRADLLRRPDVLVPGGQPAGRGGGARPARHLQGGRLRRARRDLGDRHVRRRRGDQFRRQLRAAGATIRHSASPTASSCSAPKAP